MKETIVVTTILVLVILIVASATWARSVDLPRLTSEDIHSEDRVADFVNSFINKDFQASTLLNPSNVGLFQQGYRPKIGLPYDPEANTQRYDDLQKYFTKKIYLDLNRITPFNQYSLLAFIDQVGVWSDQTLLCSGEISLKYGLEIQGPFNFEKELAKIPDESEKEAFKQCWLNDFILSTELRMLAWIYGQLSNTPYVMPEKRRRP